MAIGIGLHCWYCEYGPCSGECRKDQTKSVQEIRDDKIKSILEEQVFSEWWELQLQKMRTRVNCSDITELERKRIERVLGQSDDFRTIYYSAFKIKNL